jgi:ABC-type uncharacterized transport system substrate-binding protein
MHTSNSSSLRSRSAAWIATVGLFSLTLLLCAFGFADDRRLPTIGELWYADAAGMAPYQNAFRSRLRELGYVKGRTVTIVALHADGDPARLPALASKLVALNVDIMVVSVRAVDAAKRATSTIPIVCPGFTDPVAEGHVSSLARPGGNITGLSWQSSDTSGKTGSTSHRSYTSPEAARAALRRNRHLRCCRRRGDSRRCAPGRLEGS